MNEILKTISNIGIVPVVAINDASKAVPLAKALVAGGLPTAEVTFRTAAWWAPAPCSPPTSWTGLWTPAASSSSAPASTRKW